MLLYDFVDHPFRESYCDFQEIGFLIRLLSRKVPPPSPPRNPLKFILTKVVIFVDETMRMK